MNTEDKSSLGWDLTWSKAVILFAELDTVAMRSMSSLSSELAKLPEVRGLFAVKSMATLIVSPYSSDPDWFAGRRITIDAIEADVSVCLIPGGDAFKKQQWTCTFDDAANLIAPLCRDHL